MADDSDVDSRSPDLPPISYLFNLLRRRADLLIAALILNVGVGLIMFQFSPTIRGAVPEYWQQYWPSSIGFVLLVGSTLYIQWAMLRRRHDAKFIDVDRKSGSRHDPNYVRVLAEIDRLRREQPSVDYERIHTMLVANLERDRARTQATYDGFSNYFESVVVTLEEKASAADQKASILLDKGISYSKWGIAFYIMSIVVWQGYAAFRGFSPQLIFGIVSCSLLFAFMEFLSAWFLRQYRHFVDTSTYLIKVKSLFDRYMLAFLAIRSVAETDAEAGRDGHDKLVMMLASDIRWPDMHMLKRGDISFAKEAMEAMSGLARSINDGKQARRPHSED